jgi:pimeloyl-ACP methyl ester carboxylesterase
MNLLTYFNHKKIAYSKLGDGFPVVFIHGFCETRSMWADFVRPFVSQYQIITIDIGGFGQSELPEIASIDAMAEQVNAVLEAEKIEKCVIVGHSMGGYTALAFAKLFGHKLQGLCMFHTHPFGDTLDKQIHRDKAIEFVQTHGSEKYVASMIPMLFAPHSTNQHKAVIQNLLDAVRSEDPKTIIHGLVAMKNRRNDAAVLENINCPVQFIIGKLDVSVSWEQSLRQASLPKIADIQIFETIGHMGMFEATEQSQQVLLSFFDFCKF